MQVTTLQKHEGQATAADVEGLAEALASPFDPREVRFKPAVVSGNRALALAYVDARVIQDRLDDVLGTTNWKDEYQVLPDSSVLCRLHLRLGDEWITKEDVGGPSEQPDGGDRMKAAFSDALKRAAVKFGIGRYLYRLPSQWVDYDPHKKQFVKTPTLPAHALPAKRSQPRPLVLPAAPAPAEPAKPAPVPKEKAAPKPTPATKRPAAKAAPNAPPRNGEELQRRLYDYDKRLADRGLCQAGDLVKHVVQAGVKQGHDPDLATWAGPAIALAVEETRAFEARARQRQPERKEVA